MSYRAFVVAVLALCVGVLTACSEGPAATVTATDRQQLTYDQVIGTGLANKCPQLSETSRGKLDIEPGRSYAIRDMCLQPTDYFAKEEPVTQRQDPEFVPGKLLTRATTSLEQIRGKLEVDDRGNLTLREQDGIDFQPITIQLPGGKEVPFMFTVKGLVANAQSAAPTITTSTDFQGQYVVTPYRGGGFLDTRGRGPASGYDGAIGLPARADSDELARENIKQLTTDRGNIDLKVAKVNANTGEIAGTFESEQPSHTDMGAKEPEDVKIRGVFYARVAEAL